ncbi:MAG: MCE family protein [Phycisphaeraceae bacterium]|nr:MCE family protein [Phycisphaeraceae bacterium]MBX3407555.1 MCE family protein [Phycisphaeraceae bacterium]
MSELPQAEIVRAGAAATGARVGGRAVSILWFVPVLAVGLVGVLFFQAYAQRGPLITINFANGEGLRAGDPVSFRGVQVGKVREVLLTPDLAGVSTRVELNKDAAGLAVEGSRFWVVRPELSLTRVSGLETLLGPRYIEAEPGPAGAPAARSFQGLQTPPRGAGRGLPGAEGGLELTLSGTRLGSVTPGSPVVYREVRVGSVLAADLSPDSRTVDVQVRIDPAYVHLVRENTRFWNVSGIGLDLGLGGLKLRAGSLESVLAGGIAFATPNRPGQPVAPGHRFELAESADDSWLKWTPDLTLGTP